MAKALDRLLMPIVNLVPLWITPNAISVGRTLMVIPIILTAREHPYIAGFALFLPAMLLDILDGPLARSRGQVSALGAFLDSTGDKVFIHGTLWFAVYPYAPILLWPAIALSALDLSLILVRPIKYWLGISGNANLFGKAKTWLQAFTVGFFLVRTTSLFIPTAFLMSAMACAVYSLIFHLRDIQNKLFPPRD